jgi:hypothetical protein
MRRTAAKEYHIARQAFKSTLHAGSHCTHVQSAAKLLSVLL